jgi:hypothetical protein
MKEVLSIPIKGKINQTKSLRATLKFKKRICSLIIIIHKKKSKITFLSKRSNKEKRKSHYITNIIQIHLAQKMSHHLNNKKAPKNLFNF